MVDYGRLKTDLLALAIFAVAMFVGVSLITYDPMDPPGSAVYPVREGIHNYAGVTGARAAHGLITLFGVGAYAVLTMLVVWNIRLFARDSAGDMMFRLVGAMLVVVALCVAAQWFFPVTMTGPLAGNGGNLGAWCGIWLDQNLSRTGSVLLLASMLVAGVLMTGEQHLIWTGLCLCALPITMWSRLAFGARPPEPIPPPDVSNNPPDPDEPAFAPVVSTSFEMKSQAPQASTSWYSSLVEIPAPVSTLSRIMEPVKALSSAALSSVGLAAPAKPVDSAPVSSAETDQSISFTLEAGRAPIKVNPPVGLGTAAAPDEPGFAGQKAEQPVVPVPPFQLPEFGMLEDAEAFPYDVLAAKAQVAAATLERTFQEFGLNVKVVEIDTGPVITQFELELEKGLRLSKVTSLADDLAIALRVASVRVVAPIPGKNTVGVEVPNDVRVMVRLKELLETCHADFESKGIPMFLGKDVSGKPLVVDLCKMPHLLIAGRTGTGKSVCLNTLILSILMSRSPEQVRMLMIDPKMVELSPYSRIPHLMHPVITDMKKAEAVLGWAVDKMEERYDLLSRVGVRHIDGYNKLGKDKVLKKLDIEPGSEEADLIPETMPYIVIVADEMADMIMTSGKDVEGHIIRLAQKSRAIGIHLVLATQKPTVDVITGLIKSNLPSRIAFQVSSRNDSRVVLDENGADKLLGNGDMLYLAPGTSTLRRAQGTYVSDDEVNRVIDFYSDQPPQYDPELEQLQVASAKDAKGASEPRVRDDLYDEAVEVVIREGRGSVSLLQRALGVGYGRGARMIDWMAEDGVVGTHNGSQAREVVMTLDQWDEFKEERDMAMAR